MSSESGEKQNLETILSRYCQEMRAWAKGWLESNFHKELPVDEKGELNLGVSDDALDIWAPNEQAIEFSEEIARDYIAPILTGGGGEPDEADIIAAEEIAYNSIVPILHDSFIEEILLQKLKMEKISTLVWKEVKGSRSMKGIVRNIIKDIYDEQTNEVES